MEYRTLGRTDWQVSTVSFGAWAIGGTWGAVDDDESMAALHRALDRGVNFFDTADVYGDGHSERLLARLRARAQRAVLRRDQGGPAAAPQTVEGYNRENLTAFVERSLKNLEIDDHRSAAAALPADRRLLPRPRCSGLSTTWCKAGKIRFYGVSVERVEEALKAIEYPGVQSVQIIYNIFRQRPAELFFAEASAAARSASWRGCRCRRGCWPAR